MFATNHVKSFNDRMHSFIYRLCRLQTSDKPLLGLFCEYFWSPL